MSVVVLTGGIGGAKLVLGLVNLLPRRQVTAVVNTGDDFEHLGLAISPDIDTLLYTLAGKADAARGWGRATETWTFMDALCSLGGPDWFALGDGDLALHVIRTQRRRAGDRLSAITADVAAGWGIGCAVLPMSDDPVATMLDTAEGRLDFQDYFVARRCTPSVTAVHYRGADQARPAPGVVEALRSADTRAILIAPSNPVLSIAPILAVPAIRQALAERGAPAIAVAPFVGGEAVKGPTVKLMRELGLRADAAGVAQGYAGLIDGLLVDERDPPVGLAVAEGRADTLMVSLEDRVRVAREALAFADRLRS